MATADEIRVFAKTHYVHPARRAGASEVAIRVGNVHSEMGLKARHPLVCGALRSKKFEQLCGIEMTKQTGPHQSSTTTFYSRLSHPRPTRVPLADVAGKSSASTLVAKEKKRQRILGIDELAKLRRRIVDWMSDIEGQPPSLERPGQRVSRLKREGKIPRTVAQCMFTIIEARNEGEYQRTRLTEIQSAAVLAAWAAVQEWRGQRFDPVR